jgi:ankyrin repeat protein
MKHWFRLILVALVGCAHAAPRPMPPDQAVALVTAVRSDSSAVVTRLLDAGVSPDTEATDGTRPLAEAARNGRLGPLQLLLQGGARLDAADSAGNNAFDYAMASGNREVMGALVLAAVREAGPSDEAQQWFGAMRDDSGGAGDWHRVLDGELLSLGLLYAIVVDRPAVATSLRQASGMTNRLGYPPLVAAARLGEHGVVDALLHASAGPDTPVGGHWHETALMEAARDGDLITARALLRAGARVNRTDSRRQTALFWAVREGETEYAKGLLDAGADPRLRDASGETALDLAHSFRHDDLVALLSRPR